MKDMFRLCASNIFLYSLHENRGRIIPAICLKSVKLYDKNSDRIKIMEVRQQVLE